jgi:hypothetical protein
VRWVGVGVGRLAGPTGNQLIMAIDLGNFGCIYPRVPHRYPPALGKSVQGREMVGTDGLVQ